MSSEQQEQAPVLVRLQEVGQQAQQQGRGVVEAPLEVGVAGSQRVARESNDSPRQVVAHHRSAQMFEPAPENTCWWPEQWLSRVGGSPEGEHTG